MAERRATQKDVAVRAGVSQAAVSMVLSGRSSPSIPAETWERITTAARELNYVPNRFAQALRTQRSMTIACIVPDITNPFYPTMIRGVQSVAQERGYDVIAVNTDADPVREQHFLRWAQQGRVDGIIAIFFTVRSAELQVLIEAGIPVVRLQVAGRRSHGTTDDIYVDNRAAAQAATDHLIGKGHRCIAMVAGTGGPQAVRARGYKDALQRAGLEPGILVADTFDEIGGYQAGLRLLQMEPRPTAVFAANDLMAIGIMQAMRESGVDVPDGMAVVGFDDIPAAKLVEPPLTTVTQFQGSMGERAAALLLERLQGQRTGEGVSEEMPFRLVPRRSA